MTLSEGNGPMIMSHAADLLPGLNIGEMNLAYPVNRHTYQI